MNKAVFLDRDGVLNVDKGYVHRIEDWEFTENAPQALKIINDSGYKIIIVSNQSGVGRGYYTEKDIEILQRFVEAELSEQNAFIDGWYYCPHAPEDNCNCRKPKTALVERAIKAFDIDVSQSWFIGDKRCDAECAVNAGLRPAMITSDEDTQEYAKFGSLAEFAQFLIRNF